MVKCFWLLSGVCFALFEALFWVRGYDLFRDLFNGVVPNEVLLSVACLLGSVACFGLFIKFTGYEIKYRLEVK